MYGFFDKHGKKLLALASVLLIVVFLLPPNVGHNQGGSGVVGTINGEKVDSTAVQGVANGLRDLSTVLITTQGRDGRPQLVPLPQALFGGLAEQFLLEPVAYYLLVHEARQAGAMPTEARVSEALRPADASTRYLDGRREVEYTAVPEARLASHTVALTNALAVADNFSRAQRSVKVSEPMVDQAVAQRSQQIKIHAAVFDAAEYESQVAAPADDALRAQFDAFAAIAPGTGDASNPFGFGYRVPDRLRVQHVLIPDAELQRVIEATKTPDQWEEDARVFYLRNPRQFSSDAGNMMQGTAAASQPTTRPFAEARGDVIKAVQEPQIAQRRQAVLNRVNQFLTAEAQNNKDKAALADFSVLTKLRDDLQQKFGVTVTVTNEPGLIARPDFDQLPGIGQAQVQDRTPGSLGLQSAGAILFGGVKALQPSGSLELFQPSPAMKGPGGTFVVRVVEAEANHPARTLADVKPQLERDLRRKEAYALAAQAADKASKENPALSLKTLSGRPVLTSDWIDFGTMQPIKGMTGIEGFSIELVAPSFKMLRSVQSRDQLPVRQVVPLQSQGKAVVVELFDAKNRFTADQLAFLRMQAASTLSNQLVGQEVVVDWFKPESIYRRVGYTSPQQSETSPEAPADAPRPRSPFMPG